MGITFTHSEANRALIFVKPVIEDIQKLILELATLQQNPEAPFFNELEDKISRIKYHFDELKQVGCLCRDPERGIVDFPSFYKQAPIYLNWHLGEETVAFWRNLKENPENRLPIDDGFLEANAKTPQAIA